MNFGMLRTGSNVLRGGPKLINTLNILCIITHHKLFQGCQLHHCHFQKHHRQHPNWLHRHHKFFVQCTLKTPADTCKAQTPWDWEWYPWSQSSNAVCRKPRLLPGSGNFKFKNVLLFEKKKNLLLFENSELNKAGTNSDCRKFGGGGAIVWQKLRLRKISLQIVWRLVNTIFNLSECVSRPVFETDSNCNAASSCSQNP